MMIDYFVDGSLMVIIWVKMSDLFYDLVNW